MQITISLCLLVTIFKLAAGGIIKRDADTEISNFDALEIQQNIKKQLLVLLSHGVTKWQNANTFSIMQQIPDELFNIKVQQELNDVQIAAEFEKTKGRDVEHCVKNMKDELNIVQQYIKSKLTWCTNAGRKTSHDGFNTLNHAMKAGYEALEKLENIYNHCYMNVFDLKECLVKEIEKAKQGIENFNDKLKLYLPTPKHVLNKISKDCIQCLNTYIQKALDRIATTKLITRMCIDDA